MVEEALSSSVSEDNIENWEVLKKKVILFPNLKVLQKSMVVQRNNKSKASEIGHSTGKSESTSVGNENSITSGVDIRRSSSISYTITDTINNRGNNPCQILLYKKVARYVQIASCYDYNEKTKTNIHSRCIELEIPLYKNEDYKSFLLECKENTEEYLFIPEENEFTRLSESLRPSYPSILNHDYFLEFGQILGIITSLGGDHVTQHSVKLTMKNNNLIFSKGDVELLNTNTTYTRCSNVFFRISSLNHLEALTSGEEMFKPVGIYGEKFKDVNYMDNPDLPDFTKSF
ncbi:hypothetical protein BCR36DRAFT_462195 [Piromyces finnis]|uniref:Uncharacterized protein n=1 Tax=Piromyces finnis TaxID=1754191 RepID=A0A1Y1VJC5_9FUNG|nr:hypothetical protein BCR36DRAFT_462195 [Piromyces finnis]|eukprot:ORX57152.1 hypothetical protein BCR36DRAFT_462195 [Piromyces finnis]